MIFGSSSFGIEVGELTTETGSGDSLVQFKFIIDNHEVGDWEDRIRLRDSLHYAKIFHDCKAYRIRIDLADAESIEVFKCVYDAFFDYDYSSAPPQSPNLRDRFHLDDIGLGAISDRFGLVIVDVSETDSRIVVKRLSDSAIVCDLHVASIEVDETFQSYMAWGRSKVAQR